MNQNQSLNQSEIDNLCINTIRTLAMDAIEKAKSGHPGAPMGLAPAVYVLWAKFLKHNPSNPDWYDRDRFILSGGHASMLLYSILYLTGYDVTLSDIKKFRQWKSKTPGHPEFRCTPGVETTTGPLGQGFANAVGMAMAERHHAAVFNRGDYNIVDHFTYVVCGDGDIMEGISSEAASMAGHFGLSKLICLYDDNKISIEGNTDIAFTENVALKFEALNWHVQKVEKGNDPDIIADAIEKAKNETSKPSIILLRTNIAFGSPNKQDTADAHGAPLGEEEVRLTKKNLNWPKDAVFHVPEKVLAHLNKCVNEGQKKEAVWDEKFTEYSRKFSAVAKEFNASLQGLLNEKWDSKIPDFSKQDNPIATRAASGKVLNAIAPFVHGLMGGSADLAPSNKTIIESSHDFQKNSFDGRNIRFGVREHAMGSVLSGMALHKGIRPYGGTFLVFADYMRTSIRLAALMNLPVIYIFTHDSIAVGEDGPTHQPIEHIASLRAIPGLTVIRPADAIETAQAWQFIIKSGKGPAALVLSRQKLPVLAEKSSVISKGFINGAYILDETDIKPDIILIATGSEVHTACEAKKRLNEKGIAVRIVSMPSWELFEGTSKEYQDHILPPDVTMRIAIEAGIPMGWERYVGNKGIIIGISGFGASAPGSTVMEKFGFTSENIVQKAVNMLN